MKRHYTEPTELEKEMDKYGYNYNGDGFVRDNGKDFAEVINPSENLYTGFKCLTTGKITMFKYPVQNE